MLKEPTSDQPSADRAQPRLGLGLGRLMLLARENIFLRVERVTAHLFDATTLRVCSPLMPYLADGLTRSKDLAQQLGVSKQAVAPKVAALVERGFVECITDTEDRRSFLIQLTPKGRQFMNDVHAAVQQVEADLARELGSDRLAALRDVLEQIVRPLEGRTTAPAGSSQSDRDRMSRVRRSAQN